MISYCAIISLTDTSIYYNSLVFTVCVDEVPMSQGNIYFLEYYNVTQVNCMVLDCVCCVCMECLQISVGPINCVVFLQCAG